MGMEGGVATNFFGTENRGFEKKMYQSLVKIQLENAKNRMPFYFVEYCCKICVYLFDKLLEFECLLLKI
jgi:hypothetical protein